MSDFQGNLRPAQRRAIAALLTTRTVTQAAEAANVGERSLYRWLVEPAFRQALLEAEGGAIDQAARRLVSLSESALGVMEDILTDQEAGDAVRLRAAQAVLDYLLKLRELRNFEERLTALEGRINGQ